MLETLPRPVAMCRSVKDKGASFGMKREEGGRASRCVIRVSRRGGRKQGGRKKFMEVRNCREILEARSNIVVGCLQGLSMGMAGSVGSILSCQLMHR